MALLVVARLRHVPRRRGAQDPHRPLPAHGLPLRGQRRPRARRGRSAPSTRSTPSGTDVVVTISYEEPSQGPVRRQGRHHLPVGGGRPLRAAHPGRTPGARSWRDGATLDLDQTAVPLELDQIYDNLDKLNVALGPNGANREGALSRPARDHGRQLRRPGRAVPPDHRGLRQVQPDPERQPDEFFDSPRALQGFISTLAENDQTVRRFNHSIADVSTVLEGEKEELAAALRNLSVALGEVVHVRPATTARPRPQHRGPQPGRRGAGQAARRARRDPHRGAAGAEQPGADLQPAGRHARHPVQPSARPSTSSSPTRRRSCAASLDQADDAGTSCDALEAAAPRRGRGRAGPFGQGPNPAVAGAVRPVARRSRGGGADDDLTRAPRPARPSSAGAVALSSCSLSVAEMPLPGGTDTGDNPILVKAEFGDVLDLVPQSTVKVNDVSVGKITDIQLDGETAIVTLELPRDTDLPDNTIAEIRQTSLLGEKFVQLSPPENGASSGQLESRRRHPARRHRPQPGGRGGPGRAQPAAQRRRRGPAADHHPGAQPGPRGPRGQRQVGASARSRT